uniref:hypothetical protein n=1 Tax=Endozoicomonas sp. SESOKO1 TaxID=2828742 RepID=UPI00214952DB
MNFPILIDLVKNYRNSEPAEEGKDCPEYSKVFSRQVTTDTCCSNRIDTNCKKPTLLNTPQIEQRKAYPLFKDSLSDFVKSWGIVAGAEDATNQERQTSSLPSREIQTQHSIQDTGVTMTHTAAGKLSGDLIWALYYGDYDTADQLQLIIKDTGTMLTEEALGILSKDLKRAIEYQDYDTAERLQRIIAGTGATLTEEARSALGKDLKRAIEYQDYKTAERLQRIIKGTGATLTDEAWSALSGYLIRAIEYRDYETAGQLQRLIAGTGSTLTDQTRDTLSG